MLILIIGSEGNNMHTDENKKFDKRNIERNMKNGIITQKDYENYLAKLPDMGNKVNTPEESLNTGDFEAQKANEQPRKKGQKKKAKGK
jgi:hypothetical protein